MFSYVFRENKRQNFIFWTVPIAEEQHAENALHHHCTDTKKQPELMPVQNLQTLGTGLCMHRQMMATHHQIRAI